MLLEISIRYFRRIATPNFFVFMLMVGVIGSVAYGISEIIRGLPFLFLVNLAFFSQTLGWLLAGTRLPSWFALLLVILIGIVSIYVWVGNLLPLLLDFIRLLIGWVWGYVYRQKEIIDNIIPLQLASAELSIASKAILEDFQNWVTSLFTSTPVFNINANFLVWGTTIWMVSAWAGWILRRRNNVVLSVLPAATLLISVMGYTWADISSLLILFFCFHLLLAQTWIFSNENHWKSSGIDYPVDARVDTIIAAISISVILVFTAYFLPRFSMQKMVEAIREFTNPQVEQAQPIMDSLGIQASKTSIGRFGTMLEGGLPREHLIGAGPELTKQVVMTVQITAGLPSDEEILDRVPLYWRGLSYDRYAGSGWYSSDVSLRNYNPDEAIGISERPEFWIIEQDIRFTDNSELLFTAGDLITINRRYQVAWRSEPWQSESQEFPGDFFAAAIDEQSYQANSFIPVVDQNTLRRTSGRYPDWIRTNYLSVPIETSQRVKQLTLDLIKGVKNPYDRAKTIENYLRQFEYTTDLPSPPVNRDIADYFLFDLRKGYCDYFATTMVVMARAAFLPARLVVGYSRGTYDTVNQRFVITEADAHSWPEIYFDGIGWIPFEPTSGLNEIVYPQEPIEFTGDPAFKIQPDTFLRKLEPLFGSWILTSMILLIGLIWIWMIWITIDEWRLKRQSPEEMVIRLYWRLYRYGRQLGVPINKDSTPNEFATNLQKQIVSLGTKSAAQPRMAQASQAIGKLTESYIRIQYSNEIHEIDDQKQILSIWQNIRRQFVLVRGLSWIKILKRENTPEFESEIME